VPNRPIRLFMLHSGIYHFGLFGIPDVLLNFYFVSLGYPPEVIGLLQSLPRIGGLLTGLPIGLYANRIGARRIITISTLGVALSLLAVALFPSLLMLGISRFMLGTFYGAGQIANAPFMTTLASERQQTRLYAWHNIISLSMAAAGAFVGGYLPGVIANLFPAAVAGAAIPAQTSFAYGAGLALAALITLASLLPLLPIRDRDLPIPPTPRTSRAALRTLPWGRMIWLGLPLLIFGFSGGLTFPFYNLFFRTSFTLDDETVGMILGIGWIGMALLPMLNPLWERYFGRVRALGITLTIAAVAFFVLSIAPSLALAIVAYFVAISMRNTMQPLFQPHLMEMLPEQERAVTNSVGYVQWNIGWFAATSMSGFWQTTYGFDFIMQVVAISVFVTALVILFIFQGGGAKLIHEPTH
jgi:MFS family permease